MKVWGWFVASAWLLAACGSDGEMAETDPAESTSTSNDSGAGGMTAGAGGQGGESASASAANTTAASAGVSTSSTSTSATSTGSGSSSTTGASTAASSGAGGSTPTEPVDLRADGNRDGAIDFSTDDDDTNEDAWSFDRGAVFLANIDDDQLACPTNVGDAQLAACNDASDDVVNGAADLDDLARLQTRPWPSVPAGASGSLKVSSAAAPYVRLFKKSGTTFKVFAPGSSLSAAELEAGVEFAIEGKDIVRKSSVWDGFVDLTFTVTGAGIDSGSDTVQMRLAPAIFRHHLDPVSAYYVTKLSSQASVDFRTDLFNAATDAGVSGFTMSVSDQWTQDFFETAYMAMPAVGGGGKKKVIDLNFRSANFTNSKLRAAGQIVFTGLRGKDTAGAVVYDPAHNDGMDTLNSFGNLETIPPYTYAGKSWPLGRVIRGSTKTFYPDTAFDGMVQSQGVQDIVYVDTAWLLVAHVDETLSFVKANSPRGWVMLVSDPTGAKKMLEQQKANGYGSATVFSGLYWADNSVAQTSINAILANADVMNESAWAATQIAEQVVDVKTATGLTDAELVDVPFLYWKASGYSVAYQPGTVNGIYLSDTFFAAPKPHGPVINGSDIFETQLTQALEPFGVKTRFIEDWYLYHALDGEVHCGSNTKRSVPANTNWWEG